MICIEAEKGTNQHKAINKYHNTKKIRTQKPPNIPIDMKLFLSYIIFARRNKWQNEYMFLLYYLILLKNRKNGINISFFPLNKLISLLKYYYFTILLGQILRFYTDLSKFRNGSQKYVYLPPSPFNENARTYMLDVNSRVPH